MGHEVNPKKTPFSGMEVELLAFPGLSVKLRHSEKNLELTASGALRAVLNPLLKKINSRLYEEKPVLVLEDRVIASGWLPPIPGPAFKRLLLAETQIALGKFIPETVSIEITHANGSPGSRVGEVTDSSEADAEDLDSKVLSTEVLKRVIDEALELGALIITFTENDPLLRKDAIELIDYVDKTRAIVNCSTWGTAFSKETAFRLKEAGLHSLMVGIYSANPEKHDALRKTSGAYEKAVSAIKTGLDAGLLVLMTTHVSPSNMQELPALYALATELGVQEFSIWEAMPKTRKEPRITDEDRETILEMYHRINSDPKGPRVFANTYFEGQMLGAMAGRRWMHITAEGDVKPSPYLPFSFGNVNEEPLKNIWQKIRSCPYFQRHKSLSPMHDPEFLEFVDRIPAGAKLPYPFDKVYP